MKRRRSKNQGQGRSAFALMDEALYLVRQAGLQPLVTYYIGSMPFMLGLLYFWSDMGQNAFARQYAAAASLGMALLFVWMKTWQAVYARQLQAVRLGEPLAPLNLRLLWRTATTQAVIQPWGLLLLPLSIVLLFPFAWTYAFFQNATVLDHGEPGADTGLIRQAVEQSRLWSFQNHILIWILSPWLLAFTLVICFGMAGFVLSYFQIFTGIWSTLGDIPWFLLGAIILLFFVWPMSPLALAVAVNFGLVLFGVPYLLNTLFGVETIFIRAGIFAFANTTLLAAVYCATYLTLDPLVKAAYMLRCFYGSSRKSGLDLIADLKMAGKSVTVAGILLFCLLLPPMSRAADTPPAAPAAEYSSRQAALDETIRTVLQERRYAWRLPRGKITIKQQDGPSWLASIFSSLERWLTKPLAWLSKKAAAFFDWLENLFRKKPVPAPTSGTDFAGMSRMLAIFMLGVTGILLIVLLWRLWQQRRKVVEAETHTVAAPDLDITSEEVTADQLPENEWRKLARELLNRKKPRLALRALYLADLASLEEQQLISIRPFKSNRDYQQELARRSHELPALQQHFREIVRLFESSWYGDHPVTGEVLKSFLSNQEHMRRCFA